ncbi:MAG: hypothetical protein KDC35_05330 [Acidobacteria bacterium]|nr:hypothetical protein [Acidobacteriota bacterium]
MKPELSSLQRWLVLTMLGLAGVYCAVILVVQLGRPLYTDDMWWHLRTGQIILEHGFPTQDPFLFTAHSDKPFFHEWLFQVILASVHSVVGLYGLRFYHVFMGGICLWSVWRYARSMGCDRWLAFLATGTLVVFAYQRLYQMRPDLFTIFCFYLALSLFNRGLIDGWRRTSMALFCLIIVFWGNAHSLVMVYLPMVSAACGIALMYRHPNARSSVTVMGLSMAALSLNPRGPHLYTFFFAHNANNPLSLVIDEWGAFTFFRIPPYFPLSSPTLHIATFCLSLALLAATILIAKRFVSSRQTAEMAEMLLTVQAVLALAALVYAIRFLWMVPVIIVAMQHHLRRWPVFSSMLFLITVVCHFNHPSTQATFFPLSHPYQRDLYRRMAFDAIKFNHRAVAFLKDHELHGNVLNPYFMGGYLAYWLPQSRTFVDGRFDRYSAEVDADQNALKNGSGNWVSLSDKYRFDMVIAPHTQDWQPCIAALTALEWPLIYSDADSSIYARPSYWSAHSEQLAHIWQVPDEKAVMNETIKRQAERDWLARYHGSLTTPETDLQASLIWIDIERAREVLRQHRELEKTDWVTSLRHIQQIMRAVAAPK